MIQDENVLFLQKKGLKEVSHSDPLHSDRRPEHPQVMINVSANQKSGSVRTHRWALPPACCKPCTNIEISVLEIAEHFHKINHLDIDARYHGQ